MESKLEIEFVDQFELAQDFVRVKEKEFSHDKNNYFKISSTDPDISMNTVEVSKINEGLTRNLEEKGMNSIQKKNNP